MGAFNCSSTEKLNGCDWRLRMVFNVVVLIMDCTILEGQRGKERQDEAFIKGRSTKKWPESTHNTIPSKAVDVAPCPIEWEMKGKNPHGRFYFFSGIVFAVAWLLRIKLRWGGDWDGDTDLDDQDFYDLVHWEVVE